MINMHTKFKAQLSATKISNATQNVEIIVYSHPLGDLGVTQRVHLWLDGKCIVDFLLVIIELFSLALMAAALLSESVEIGVFRRGGLL